MRIRQLPIEVANQIAAGEVIERPASVVKELLENALDAGADSITVDIGHGGLNQIKVIDNGVGIHADDLLLAIAPHATSKINRLDDLYSILSMGFRGEALASIASISRLIMSSKTREQTTAVMLDHQLNLLTPCARNVGTTVDVRDIFYNAPVRKKFLQTERSEFQAIEGVVKRFALSSPEIGITLNHNGKQQLYLPSAPCESTRLLRVRKLFGKKFTDQAIFIDVKHASMRLQGWIGGVDYQRSQTDRQWIYVNNRMVKDKLLNHAVKQAYENWLYPGRHPSCLLYFTLDPSEVDVNVHPTKHELRFQQPRLIHDFVRSQVQKALQMSIPLCRALPTTTEHTVHEMQVCEGVVKAIDSDFPRYAATGAEGSPERWEIIRRAQDDVTQFNEQTRAQWLSLNSSFAIIFLHSAPYLVNVVALHRCWLQSTLEQCALPLASRPLLVPVIIVSEEPCLEDRDAYQLLLKQVGIELEFAKDHGWLVRSVPLLVPQLDIKRFFNALVNDPAPSIKQLLLLLSQYQACDTQYLTEEEKKELITYLQPESLKSLMVTAHSSDPADKPRDVDSLDWGEQLPLMTPLTESICSKFMLYRSSEKEWVC